MSHLAKALALSVVLSCSGSKPAEPPAAVPGADPVAAEPAPDAGAAVATGAPATPPAADPTAPAAVSHSVTKTLFVGESLVSCEGEVPRDCLLVRESESEPWRRLYTSIEGFTHEPLYSYELRVAATTVPNPPADGSAVRYRLIEIVSKRKGLGGTR